MLLAQALKRLLYFFVSDCDGGSIGAQFLVALHLDLRHDFEAGFEAKRLTFMNMKVRNARLRYRQHPQLLRFTAEMAGHQRLNHFALEILGKTLADDRSRHVPPPKPG